MNRKTAVLGLFLVSLIRVHAQVGNEWINFNQSYFKIPVAKDGVYKLTYNDLQAAGFPVSTTDPSTIRLFHRGVEQAIYIEGEGDAQFNNTDFIEFYGRRNDGTLDTRLYKPASAQPHTYYNLYNDTTSYFLTAGSGAGKRMTSFFEDNTSGLPAETYHLDEKLLVLTQQYSGGASFNSEIYNSIYDQGEGWMGIQLVQGQNGDYNLANITNGVTAAGTPQLELLLVGRGPMNHQAQVYVGSSFRLLTTATFNGFAYHKITQNIEWSDIAADGKLTVRVRVAGNPDRFSVAYIKLRYPQRTNAASASEKIFYLTENAGNKSYISIENAAAGLRLFDVTNPESVVRIGTTSSATLNAVVPSTSGSRKILATTSVISPSIKPVSFRPIVPAQHDYIIITHPLLRKPALGYNDPVEAYAEYRASPAGGGYDTLVVNIQQLYDQFNYGESSPLAIFQFMKFLSATNTPKYLFLVGKGLDVWLGYFRNPGPFADYKDLVPTSGFPGSDMLFTVGLNGTTNEPAVPTGRLTAMNPAQVAAYLDKVKEMEALPYDDLWRKKILHLSGGIEEGEPEAFKGYLEEFQAVAEDYHLGGKVSAIAKQSRELQVINIAEHVNKGLNLVTFFGHSSPSTLDFDIGFVTDPVMGYNNTGKYPMLIMNGCEAGAFFLYGTLFGEDWIHAQKKGATGFIAHTSFGLNNTLKLYSETLYNVAYGDSVFIRKGIGDIQKETARRYMENAAPVIVNYSQVQQMLLLGDPAVKLFGAPRPDLEINNDNLSVESFDGGPVTALTDSFRLKVIVRNFGQAKPGLLRMEVVRTLNDNSTITYDSLFDMTKYSDTLSFVIRRGEERGAGNNSFTVTIDPDNIIPELKKDNNTATTGFFIPLNGTKNLFPVNFAIVNSKEVNLSFQTTDLLSGERDFIVELDTVSTFDSPYKSQFTAKGTVLASKAISLLEDDTLAYFWRTKLAQPQPGEQDSWEQSSFTYIDNGPEGWAQVHFEQYLTNTTEGLVTDAVERKLTFEETVTSVSVRTFGSSAGKPVDSVSVKIDGAEFNLNTQGWGCRNHTLNLIAFDRRSTVPYIGVYFKWYEILYEYGGRKLLCGREPFVINSFMPAEMNTGNNDDLIQYVNNVAAGDSVLLYSTGDAGYSAWPAAAKAKLGELGISVAQIDALQPGEPVVIFARKGLAPGTAKIYRASGSPINKATLTVNETVTGRYSSGVMNSGLIGPAQQWEAFVPNPKNVEPVDEVTFDVVGVKLNGEEQTLLQGVTGDQDLAGIEAEQYPYLKINFHSEDDINLTSAQLRNWLVIYTPVPEGLLLYDGNGQQTLTEGERWQAQYRFVNIGEKSFPDSLQVRVDVFNQDQRQSSLGQKNIKAPAPGDTTHFSVRFDTENKGGVNDVNVFVNPRVVPEQYYDNNVLELKSYLRVETDHLAPVLDVTIDGRYVVNDDFVSANPLILAKVWDANSNTLKTDTTGMRIFLTYPCGEEECDPAPVFLSGEDVKWYPATSTSEFSVEFAPKDLEDGRYTLRVEAGDARGNSSGATPYEISFVVRNETTVVFYEPYPNPFVNEIYIPFSVTGSDAPEAFGLQIMDVHGKVVRTIPQNEARELYVGKNEVVWNGTDTQGNVLPKGVYVYRLSLNVNSKQYNQHGKLVVNR